MFIRMVMILAVLLATGAPAGADFKIQDWTFDKDAPGGVPVGFSVGPASRETARWAVTTEPQSSSPPNVLARVGPVQAGVAPQVIFLDGIEAGNLDLLVRLKALDGGEGQGAGIVFRAQDDRTYYVAWVSFPEGLMRLDKMVNGARTPLQEVKVAAEIGKWHSLRISIRGAVFEAFFDNKATQFLSAREDAWQHGSYKHGKIGLWAQGPATVHYDSVRLTAMDGGTGSAPLGGTETTIIK